MVIDHACFVGQVQNLSPKCENMWNMTRLGPAGATCHQNQANSWGEHHLPTGPALAYLAISGTAETKKGSKIEIYSIISQS